MRNIKKVNWLIINISKNGNEIVPSIKDIVEIVPMGQAKRYQQGEEKKADYELDNVIQTLHVLQT